MSRAVPRLLVVRARAGHERQLGGGCLSLDLVKLLDQRKHGCY
eukprot:CAMPEP_0175977682 /NCGR_PEP_ID=MMETSP0108-20121206/45216_1 /TAXON_ID=195067 ORGANISM="Goniomonas pacifica, Strain CCMP1869" /NCGR_SAMPLE_ID=MMETSP0108 /ASSEMBLY_ACC=CAM_ASM_000204 /LENGTH=42 /DNA_ID= /DNA_START= /DNA_END= /DNA_ORIENTATION=